MTTTDFYLTDEHDDDNSQEALLGILHGCSLLTYYSEQIQNTYKELKAEQDPAKRAKLKSETLAYADTYDEELEKFLFSIRSALKDVDRRIGEAGLWRQLWRRLSRPTGRLPPGVNPPPLQTGDPRLHE